MEHLDIQLAYQSWTNDGFFGCRAYGDKWPAAVRLRKTPTGLTPTADVLMIHSRSFRTVMLSALT